jgi:hypothetical protein
MNYFITKPTPYGVSGKLIYHKIGMHSRSGSLERSGSTKWTIHRNWQRRSHKTKNKNQTKTNTNRTQCALDTTISTEIDNNFGYEKITQLVGNIPLRSVLLIFLVFCVLLLCFFTFWVPCCDFAYKRCSVRLYPQLFVRGLVSY